MLDVAFTIVRSGEIAVTELTVEDELLPVLVSPPPATLAVLVIDAGALAAMLTVKLTAGAACPAGMPVLFVQLSEVAVDATQFQPDPLGAPAMVRPVGIVSLIE